MVNSRGKRVHLRLGEIPFKASIAGRNVRPFSGFTLKLLLVSLLSGSFAFTLPLVPVQAATKIATTTTLEATDLNPQVGQTVTFTMTVTPQSYTGAIPLTGNIAIYGNGNTHQLCATSTLTITNLVTGAVSASCTWVAVKYNNAYLTANYYGDSNYSSSVSSQLNMTMVGIESFYIPRGSEGTDITLSATATNAGTLTFKVDGSALTGTGCSSTFTTPLTRTCVYRIPSTPTQAYQATHIFSIDYTPSTRSLMVDQMSTSFTPDIYYLPQGDNMFSSNLADYNTTSKDIYVSRGYIEVNSLFYKVNRSTKEAMVVGYDRFAGISALNIPAIFTLASNSPGLLAACTAKSLATAACQSFVGTYTVAYTGNGSFRVNAQTVSTNATHLRSVTLPATLKIIGDYSFSGQCGISSMTIPDSVEQIGMNSFAEMGRSGASGGNLGYVACRTDGPNNPGISSLGFGYGLRSIGAAAFISIGTLNTLVFRGAPSDLKAFVTYERSFDLWQFTSAAVNSTLRWPIAGESGNACSTNGASVLTANGTSISVLSSQSAAWTYWASGCLTAANIQATSFTPSSPAAPTLSNATTSSITVSYGPSSSNGGETITSYAILSSTDDWATSSVVTSAASSPFVVTGLTAGTAYKFKVTATNSVGTSPQSNTSPSFSTLPPSAPGVPTIGTVLGTSATAISIPYTTGAINGSAITGFTTTSSPSVSLTLTSAATANPLTYSGTFVQGQAYTFSMTATNGAGTSSSSSASNSITPYAAAAPAAGIIGSVTSSNATTVSVPFTAPASNGSSITSYSVSSSPSIALTYSGTTSPMAVTGTFVQGQSYTFTIAATNGAGSGAASSASNALTPFAAGPPDAPTIGFGTVIDSQTVTVSFSSPANNRGAAIANYTATSSPGGITASSTSSPITVSGLTVNTAYTFTVTATNSAGTSDSSTATSSITPKVTYSVTFNSQGGSSISDGSFISGESVTAPGSNPTRSGYTYNGWFAAATGGSVLVFPYSPGVTSNITLYAQWTVIPVVVPPAAIPEPVAQTGPPPSTLKTITSPKISRDDKGYYCEVGKFIFIREGRSEETPKLTTQVFLLLLDGKVVETQKSALDKVLFTKSDSFMESTLTCQVEVGQENLTTTSYSLNSESITLHALTKRKAIEVADTKYYKDREDAYTKKDLEFARLATIKAAAVSAAKSSREILAASANYQKAFAAASELWKKELAHASTNRVLAKELAQKQYLDALEAAGISIYPVAVKAVVTPTPTPTPTPTQSPKPTPAPTIPAVNVQPTAEMKKVGTLYMASGTYFLNDASKISLQALALKIKASDKSLVLVYGHTDSRGGVNNTTLSQNRAKAVANYLRPLLKGKKIVIGWYASRKPVTTGTTAADLAKNRRVEIYTK